MSASNEEERVIVVRRASWGLARTIARITKPMRRSGLEARIQVFSSRSGEVDFRSAESFSALGLMRLQARLGDEILVKASGPDATEVLDLFEATVEEASEEARQLIEGAIERAREEGDFERADEYASCIEPRKPRNES